MRRLSWWLSATDVGFLGFSNLVVRRLSERLAEGRRPKLLFFSLVAMTRQGTPPLVIELNGIHLIQLAKFPCTPFLVPQHVFLVPRQSVSCDFRHEMMSHLGGEHA